MSGVGERTALVRILCRADGADETARLIEWTTGHEVRLRDNGRDGLHHITECLLVDTNLAYVERHVRVLEELGLEIVGKVSGVLSWSVVPSDQERNM